MPELDSPDSLHFRYRLDGLDPDWIDAGHARSAVYSQLPPGQYKFRVMVGGTDGVWREIKPPVTLTVVPHFWQTAWFHVLAIVSVIAMLAGIGIWNERRKIRRRLEKLEARQVVERMRQRIARDLHDELGSGITGIIQQGDMMLRIEPEPGQFRAAIGEMSGRLRKLSVALDEIVWTMNSRNDTLPNLVGYISNHAQEFLRPTGIRCRLDVARNLPALPVDSQTRHNLFLAVKEALNNTAKHSSASEVMMRLHFLENQLRVSVEDNGRGFDPGTITPGDGLANIRERLEVIKGRAEFYGGPGNGTRVVLSIQLNHVNGAPHHS
jgi:signal transduction histidine kinase